MRHITAPRIRAIRNKLNLTQPEFARFIGVSQQTLADWERGRLPRAAKSIVLLLRLANK